MNNIVDMIILIVNKSLDDLYEKDFNLITNDSSERNIVFHFGRYLINNLANTDYFSNCNVDFEYNKDVFNEKKYKEILYENRKHRILPDIIVHERGSNDNNILAIEFKKVSNKDKKGRKNDYLKLKALTSNSLNYKYKVGLFIELSKTREKVTIEIFVNGKHVSNKKSAIL